MVSWLGQSWSAKVGGQLCMGSNGGSLRRWQQKFLNVKFCHPKIEGFDKNLHGKASSLEILWKYSWTRNWKNTMLYGILVTRKFVQFFSLHLSIIFPIKLFFHFWQSTQGAVPHSASYCQCFELTKYQVVRQIIEGFLITLKIKYFFLPNQWLQNFLF